VIEGPAAVRNKLGGAFFDRFGRCADLGRQVDTRLVGEQVNALRELAQSAGPAGVRPEWPTSAIGDLGRRCRQRAEEAL